jgi:YesN/AraC family two-component response regulator
VIRVVIADDQELVRPGLQLVLEARGCEVVGVAGDGREAVDVIRRTDQTWRSWISGCP